MDLIVLPGGNGRLRVGMTADAVNTHDPDTFLSYLASCRAAGSPPRVRATLQNLLYAPVVGLAAARRLAPVVVEHNGREVAWDQSRRVTMHDRTWRCVNARRPPARHPAAALVGDRFPAPDVAALASMFFDARLWESEAQFVAATRLTGIPATHSAAAYRFLASRLAGAAS